MRTATFRLMLVGLLASLPVAAWGQSPPGAADSVVDQVVLKHGPRLLGAVFERAQDGTLTIAVTRNWLKRAYPPLYQKTDAEQRIERKAALEELRDRLVLWTRQRPEPAGLAFFLQQEADRVAKALAAGDDATIEDGEFLLLKIPPAQIERARIQPVDRKRVALLAWRERLSDVETRTAVSLHREFQKLKLNEATEPVDLFDRLPIRRQNDSEWAARRALVEYQLRRPLDFQGTGNLLLPTGEGAKAPPAGELLTAILQEQLASQLSGLLDDGGPAKKPDANAGLESASRTAEREGVAGFRVTRVAPDPADGRVQVETAFLAKTAEGRWETVWRYAETLTAERADKDRMERIAQDPQVKQALELMKGLGAAGEAPLQMALRMGAVTMQAQQEADARFFTFRDRYLSHLEGPPLPLAGAPVR